MGRRAAAARLGAPCAGVLLGLGLLLSPLPAAPRKTPEMPYPGPHGRALGAGDAATENAKCEGCHQDIAAEWRASLHRQSDTDPIYKRALAIEPLAFCRGCHAPEADPSGPAPEALSAIGVSCVTCHAPEGSVLAAPNAGASANGGSRAPTGSSVTTPNTKAPHGVMRVEAFGGEAACAGCHEFAFPHDARRAERLLMQSTRAEHLESPFAGAGCAGCHMPLVENGKDSAPGRHRSHAFVASRDPALLRSAARISATRAGGAVRVRIEPVALGHAFPTGDLFRRIEVSAEAIGADQAVAAEASRYLARHFEVDKVTRVKKLKSDDRVSSREARVIELDLGAQAAGKPVAWRVAYQRVEHPTTAENEGAAVVEGEVVLAEGVLRP
jgi:hypothetical protein